MSSDEDDISELEEEEEEMWNSSKPSRRGAGVPTSSSSSSTAALQHFREDAQKQELLRAAQTLKLRPTGPTASKQMTTYTSSDEHFARQLQREEYENADWAKRRGRRAVEAEDELDSLLDSDEEEGFGQSSSRRRPVVTRRRQAAPPPAKRKLVVASSSSSEEEEEDEDEEEEENQWGKPPRKSFLVNPAADKQHKKKRVFVMSSSEEEEEEEDEDEDDDQRRQQRKPPPPVKKQQQSKRSAPAAVVELVDSDTDAAPQHDNSEEDEDDSNSSEEDGSSVGDDDDDDENAREVQVQKFMVRCESISTSLLRKVRDATSSSSSTATVLDVESAAELVNHHNGTLKLKLNPYQIAGVNWLSLMDQQDINPVLADEMGLGKTITTIALLRLLWKRDGNEGPHLVICPASTLDNWQRELQLWLPELGSVAYTGTQDERRQLRQDLLASNNSSSKRRPRIWLCTYTYFERESCADDRKFLGKQKFDVMVLDEAHAIKNTESSRYQALLQLRCRRKLLLTGTPCQNKLDELFALLSFCLPTSLLQESSKHHIREAIFGPESDPARVKRILQPFILRRLKANVLRHVLAPKTETTVFLDMPHEQRTIYQSMVREFKTKSRAQRQRHAAATSESVFTELRKAANHPLMTKHLFGNSSKSGGSRDLDVITDELVRVGFFGKQATRKMVWQEVSQKLSDWDLNHICHVSGSKLLRDMILPSTSLFVTSCKMQFLRKFLPDQIQRGHRILLFSQWTKLLDLFEELMAQLQIEFMRLDGSTAVDTRQELMDQFNAGRAPVFLLSTRAGGLGINLTSADVVVLHDLDFNPAIDNQAMDRCHRFGQTKPVTVYKLVTRDTVDESISAMQTRKTGMNRVLLGEDGDGDGVEAEAEAAMGALMPSLRDFADNFDDTDDKERERLNREAMHQAVQQALASVGEEEAVIEEEEEEATAIEEEEEEATAIEEEEAATAAAAVVPDPAKKEGVDVVVEILDE